MVFNQKQGGSRHGRGAPGVAVVAKVVGMGLVSALALVGCAGQAGPAASAAQVAGTGLDTAGRLAVGAATHGQLAPGATQRWQVAVPPGSVVRGTVDAMGLQLDVQDAQGQHVRRLLGSDGVGEGFTWLAQAGEQLVLHWRAEPSQAYASAGGTANNRYPAPVAGQYRITLAQSWAPAADQQVLLPQAPLRSPRLQALAAQLAAGASSDAFWQEVAAQGAPLVEPWSDSERLVSFVWRGARHSVRLFGSPSGNHEPLQRLESGKLPNDVWWASFVMPRDVRLSYAFAPDVRNIDGSAMEQRRSILATLQRDPLNPLHWAAAAEGAQPVDVYQGRSVLQLADAPPQPWLAKRSQVASGSLQRHWFTSAALGNGRDVWVYRPANWARTPVAQRALLVLFDAQAYLGNVPTPQIVDNLHADGLLPATAVVLVANASADARGKELPPNPDFADFMGQSLVPWLHAQGLDVPAARTVLAGSSYGGLASSYVALRYPQLFGNVLSLSGSYWWAPKGEAPNALARWWAAAPATATQFYLDAGRYESARGGQAGILETSRDLGDVLRAKGHTVVQTAHNTGHDYVHWQGSLACGLVALLNPQARILQQPACAPGLAAP